MPFIAAAFVAIAQGVGYVAAAATFAVTGSIGAALTIGTMVTTMASHALLSLAINAAVSLISPKPKAGIRGDSQKPVTDPNAPRAGLVGEFATAGTLATWQTWGTNNEYIILFFAVADHKCHSLTGAWWNNTACTINVDGSVQEAFKNGNHHLWLTFYDGDWNQAADSEMITQSGGRWTSNDRGRGVAYIKVKARFNQKAHPQGLGGLFSLMFRLKGAYLYNRTLDTTAGGAGSQRLNDQTTWAWSDNAAVIAENLLRGLRVEDTSMTVSARTTDTWFGGNLTSTDLPHAENAAAINSCDENVPLKAGGTEKRYRANGLVYGDESPRGVLESVLATMAGRVLTGPGRWIIRAGVARTPERDFIDTDFRLDGPTSYRDFTALSEVVNCVTGRYCDPAQQFKPGPLPPRTNSTYETADGGRKSESWDLAFVTSNTQGQRILKIFLERHRRQKTARRTMTPENLDLEAVDWISWQSDRYGWDLDFEIEKIHARLGEDDFLQVVADVRETAPAVYAWTAATDELDASTAATIASVTPTAVGVSGLTVTNTTVTGTGESAPGLLIDWTEVTDPIANAVRVEYRILSTAAAFSADVPIDPTTSAVQQLRVDQGVVGGATYEARGAVLYQPWRDPVFSSWAAAGAGAGATTITVDAGDVIYGDRTVANNLADLVVGIGAGSFTATGTSDTHVAFSGTDPATAKFQITASEQVILNDPTVRVDGTALIDASGFTDAARTQLLAGQESGLTVTSTLSQLVNHAASSGAIASYLQNNLGQDSTVSVYLVLDLTNASSASLSDFPTSLTVTIYVQESADGVTWGAWSALTSGSKTMTRITSGTPTSSQYLVQGRTIWVPTDPETGVGGAYTYYAVTSPASLTIAIGATTKTAKFYRYGIVGPTTPLGVPGSIITLNDTDSSPSFIVSANATGSAPYINATRYRSDVKIRWAPTSVDVDATDIVVATPAGLQRTISALSVTVDMTTTGLNALDTGTIAANTKYHIWAISNGSTDGALVSLSEAAPTMPSGYSHKMWIGFLLTDATSEIWPFQQDNDQWYLQPSGSGITLISGTAGSSLTTPTYVTASVAAYVPVRASALHLKITNRGGVVCVGPTGSMGAYTAGASAPPIVFSASVHTAPVTIPRASDNIHYASDDADSRVQLFGCTLRL